MSQKCVKQWATELKAIANNSVSRKNLSSPSESHKYFIYLTKVYDTGACVYIYFGFIYQGLADPVAAYSQIEDSARTEIMKHGGSISHHHGVGKLRKKFLVHSIGETGVNMLKGLKQTIDPQNIFATGNLI